eukprot:TRINITY_DN1830_c0_g2_i1.p1 TRINITY_DN1830_c0_g2~~TRINITY_DN1830_c0_g2_i1.p1  ORF type:complete len:186 (+),score=29.26 TRINITY_DN1830_c0_g2_i1:49-558(+)
MLDFLTRCCTVIKTSPNAKSLRLSTEKVEKSDDEWRLVLTQQEFNVLRRGATDPPHKGDYNKDLPRKGYFSCKGCGVPLFSAKSKFSCSCGWPAFDKCYKRYVDKRVEGNRSGGGFYRTEIRCAVCDGHLGHVFNGEGMTSTDQRHCVNGSAIAYVATDLRTPPEEGTI